MGMFKYLVGVAAFAVAGAASAGIVFVGSWNVYDPAAPSWLDDAPNGPLAYTGQEAAALLFGGVASDYQISTVGSDIGTIDNQAWYDVIGFGGAIHAENYSNKYLGQYYGPSSGYPFGDPNAPASAFIRDNLQNDQRINYAFRYDDTPAIPEPATWAMLITGFGLTGFAMRRRKPLEAAAH